MTVRLSHITNSYVKVTICHLKTIAVIKEQRFTALLTIICKMLLHGLFLPEWKDHEFNFKSPPPKKKKKNYNSLIYSAPNRKISIKWFSLDAKSMQDSFKLNDYISCEWVCSESCIT